MLALDLREAKGGMARGTLTVSVSLAVVPFILSQAEKALDFADDGQILLILRRALDYVS